MALNPTGLSPIANDAFDRLQNKDRSSTAGGVTTSADITRDQWQHFLDFYRPIEDDILKTAMNTDFSSQGDEAGQTAAAGVSASLGTAERNISRAGGQLTTEERGALGRRTDLSLSKAVGRAENTTRRGLSDSRTDLLRGLTQIGQGVAGSASSGLQSVADLAAGREQLHRSQKEQAHASNMSAGATLAGIAISLI